MPVRTRFAPSPTGYLHIGGLRTAAYAYALAKHEKGEFYLRIEDTDQKREIPGVTEQIFTTLGKFLSWDGVVIQSDRAKEGVYAKAAQQLLASGHAFYCQCQARNAKTEGYSKVLRDPCRDRQLTSGAIKLRVPDGETITYFDFVLNREVSVSSDNLSDTILLKSDGVFATYHLAVAVDDHHMQITHVLRGVEWVPSAPLHVLIHRYLGYDFPHIGHLSSILDPAGGKLSKRKGNVSVEQFLADGYLPEALLNFVILLGWAPKDNRELFTLSEFVEHFDIKGFQKSNPILNLPKLDWFNSHYLRQLSNTQLTQLVKPYVKSNLSDTQITQILPIVKDRITKLSDFDNLTSFFITTPEVDNSLYTDPRAALNHLQFAVDHIDTLTQPDISDRIKGQGWKVGDFFMSLRIAICGSRTTPPLTDVMQFLGPETSLSRLKLALKSLDQSN